jgi:hypothetical protein
MKRKIFSVILLSLVFAIVLFAVDYFVWDRRNYLQMSIKNVLTGLMIAALFAPMSRLRERIFNKIAKKYIKDI